MTERLGFEMKNMKGSDEEHSFRDSTRPTTTKIKVLSYVLEQVDGSSLQP